MLYSYPNLNKLFFPVSFVVTDLATSTAGDVSFVVTALATSTILDVTDIWLQGILFRWGTHLYVPLFPSVCSFVTNYISGTVHHLIIILVHV